MYLTAMECKAIVAVLVSLLVVSDGQLDRERIALMKIKLDKLPKLSVCGKSSVNIGEKIWGGQPAQLGAYPWMAAIGYKIQDSEEDGPMWLCGGSLITDQHILTAAHCVDPRTTRSAKLNLQFEVSKVRLGDLDLDPDVEDHAQPTDYEVASISFHENYDNRRKLNDIGIIKLKQKVTFTDLIKPICLPTADISINSFVGYTPIVAGWGISMQRNAAETRLLEVPVEISAVEQCSRNISTLSSRYVVDDTVICAGAPGRDSCKGDSGAPLMLYRKPKNTPINETGNMFIIGIVSYGHPNCSLAGVVPGVYTRVSKQMIWIMEKLDI